MFWALTKVYQPLSSGGLGGGVEHLVQCGKNDDQFLSTKRLTITTSLV